jgi:hypothetical protein
MFLLLPLLFYSVSKKMKKNMEKLEDLRMEVRLG